MKQIKRTVHKQKKKLYKRKRIVGKIEKREDEEDDEEKEEEEGKEVQE